MAGLFGFFVRTLRSPEWMSERLDLLKRMMVTRPHHGCHLELHPHAAFGITGPGLLAGSLTPWRHPNGAVMLAEGEVYRRGERPWPGVLEDWVAHGAEALAKVDGLYNLVRYDPPSAGGPRLSLLNDRYGSRRLFVADDPEALVFASDFQPLAGRGDAAAEAVALPYLWRTARRRRALRP